LPEGECWSVVGNLPYNAATPILARLLTEGIVWDRMVLMFQLEVAQKLMGLPGTKAYGPLSVLAQLCARLTRLVKLGPGSFRPAPKVDSAVVQFEPRPDAPSLAERGSLLTVLHRSFTHRRKTLANNWQGGLSAEALAGAGLDSTLRAEAITPAAWVEAVRKLMIHHPEVFPSPCP
jgi:16S rRNA (adenine1518-N6/adenine1519-N6)-dimethyltransferase